jgi:MYXO-CTERM domain-containing protein
MFHVKPVFFLFVVAGIMHAGIIASGTETIAGSESVNGTTRLFRNGVESTWASPKTFPGESACAGTCFFETLTFTPGSLQFVQVTETSISGNIFVAAYLDSFSNAALATNYLGDAGRSIGPGGISPLVFQVFVPTGSNLILEFNNVPDAGGIELGSVGYLVEGFTSPTPEPASLGLAALGLAALAVVRKRIA